MSEQPQTNQAATVNQPEPAEESVWLEAAKTIGLALLLAFGIRTFVAEARYIPSGSMIPTLKIDDRLIIDKVTYNFREPERGDIVVFNPTDKLKAQKFSDAFIKRVVGVPGDRVEIKNDAVFVNSVKLQEFYVYNDDPTSVATCNGGPPGNPEQPFLAEAQTIPAGQYLVLGDNRLNSYDGRCWGLVSKKHLVGRAVFRFWPLQRIGTIPDPGFEIETSDSPAAPPTN